jgi:hypothetical protein
MPPFGIGIVGEPGEVAQATGRDAFGTGLRLEARAGMLVLGWKWVPSSSSCLAAFCTFRENQVNESRARMSRSGPLDTGCPIATVLYLSGTIGRTSWADHDGRVVVKRLGEGHSAVLGRLNWSCVCEIDCTDGARVT